MSAGSSARRAGSLAAAALFGALAVVIPPTEARADAGELALGPYLCGTVPAGGRLGGALRLGVSDWIALEARLGAGLDVDEGWTGVAGASLVLAWDVLSVVPELELGGGARVEADGHFVPRLLATVGLRRYFGIDFSLSAAIGAEWSPSQWTGLVRLTAWFAVL